MIVINNEGSLLELPFIESVIYIDVIYIESSNQYDVLLFVDNTLVLRGKISIFDNITSRLKPPCLICCAVTLIKSFLRETQTNFFDDLVLVLLRHGSFDRSNTDAVMHYSKVISQLVVDHLSEP